MLQRVLRTLWWHNFSYSASGAAAGDSVGNVAKVTAGARPTERAGPHCRQRRRCRTMRSGRPADGRRNGGSKEEAGCWIGLTDAIVVDMRHVTRSPRVPLGPLTMGMRKRCLSSSFSPRLREDCICLLGVTHNLRKLYS